MRTFPILLSLACFVIISACTTTYMVHMGAVTSFRFTEGSTCRNVLRDLGRPHQQVPDKRKGYVTWRYAYQIRSDKPKQLQYRQYTFLFFQGRIRKFSEKIESYNFTGKGFRGQPLCPIKE